MENKAFSTDVGLAVEKLAHAVMPANTIGGLDQSGNYVASLTQAVMGITAALMEIASAMTRIADAIEDHGLQGREEER